MTPPSRRRLAPGEVLDLARSLHGEGRLVEAEKAYRYVLAHAPEAAQGATGLGEVLFALGRAEEAEAVLRRAPATDPEVCNVLGLALVAQGRLAEALDAYAQAVRLAPDHVAARNNFGATLQACGRSAEAAAEYEAAIRLAPDLAEPHNNLGAALSALGRPAEALPAYERALALKPDFAQARYNRALALSALGRIDDAIVEYERTLALLPNHGGAQAGLGRALAALERFEDAARRLERALEIGPETAELHNDLGAYLSALGRHEDAAAQFSRATELSPRYATAYNNLGNALAALERHRQAVEAYRTAFALEPAFAEAYANMGSALAELRHPGDALPFFERALALNPHLAETHNNRGEAFVALGHFGDARESFLRAIALKPERGEFYHGLARCAPLAAEDPHFIAMLALAERLPTLPETDQIQLHFALAKAFEDQRRFEPAFTHLSAGNALRRRRMDYDEARTLWRMGRFAEAFDAETIRRAPPRGAAPDAPIFIVGMPRSGSTLVEQILASHRLVFGGGELTYLAEEAAVLDEEAADFVARMRATPLEDFAAIGARYLGRQEALAPGAPRVTDKLPSNCQYLGLIRMALPNARIIHTRRDPVDTCLSCFAQTFSAGLAFSNDLGDLGRYYRAYCEMMAQWRRVLPAGAMLEVQYEDLVADFEPQVRRILDYCDLEWDARCLDYHQTSRPIITASATQVRRPLYRSSAGRARGYGRLLQPLVEALGDLA